MIIDAVELKLIMHRIICKYTEIYRRGKYLGVSIYN
jgi:hypothetical protein